uniref:Secreted protein n=1 Tax=Anguilla anguilla TaxID=7936 RepID=A0A0E9W6D4_ANGAN
MLVFIRVWLLAVVSSPWLPSLGGDLTCIWLRSTAALRIMALARLWNSLPICRDFSNVVLR